jgi:hypothetical protein
MNIGKEERMTCLLYRLYKKKKLACLYLSDIEIRDRPTDIITAFE